MPNVQPNSNHWDASLASGFVDFCSFIGGRGVPDWFVFPTFFYETVMRMYHEGFLQQVVCSADSTKSDRLQFP